MQWRNTSSSYGLVSIALHWTIVIGVIAQYFLAEAGEDGGGALSAMGLHISIGMTLLGLAMLRVVWRLIDRTPTPPQPVKTFELAIARSVHVAFYVLLIAIPISGWLLATVEGESLRYFGLFDVPTSTSASTLSEGTLEEVHEVLFNVLFGLALLHVAAALKHRFIDHDSVLQRMLPGRKAS